MKKHKRVTIYDLATALGISASYVSRALNDHPSISEKIKLLVKTTAQQLNYKHNSNAANLRKGASNTIGVVVPKINESFFSTAIAGIEEACVEYKHSLIICQSGESFEKEVAAIEKLISLNVDCIIISISAETKTTAHLQEVENNNIRLVQFDRTADNIDSYKVLNDNREAAAKAVKHLVEKGYKHIAYIGGPEHLSVFRERKEGFLAAIQEAGLIIPWNYITGDALTKEKGKQVATALLTLKQPPDAIFTVTDYVALGVLQAATVMGIKVPEQLGVFGFANEIFAEMLSPGLSSIEQNAKTLGKHAAYCYFRHILTEKGTAIPHKEIITCDIIIRETSSGK